MKGAGLGVPPKTAPAVEILTLLAPIPPPRKGSNGLSGSTSKSTLAMPVNERYVPPGLPHAVAVPELQKLKGGAVVMAPAFSPPTKAMPPGR
jgi:hypothetical protein